MKVLRSCLVVVGLAAALSSCSPYRESISIPPGPSDPGLNSASRDNVTSSERKAIRKQRETTKKKSKPKPTVKSSSSSRSSSRNSVTESKPKPKPKAKPKPKPKPTIQKKVYPTAKNVPGREGMVYSPYDNTVVDVRTIPSGKLVKNPNDPSDSKRFFRVP